MNSPNPSSAGPDDPADPSGPDDPGGPGGHAPGWTGARYVAMGSSFAAGPGIPHRVEGSPRPAGRSTGNYAHLVARRLGLDLVDVTFSGATTKEFVTGSAKRPAQLDAVTGETRLVTLTGGGNDVGFAPRILLSSLPFPVRDLPAVRRQLASFADPQLTEERFTQLRENLLQLAAQVRQRGETTQQAAAEAGAIFVPAGAMSASHHAWSADPWTRRFHLSLHNGAPYHPNAKGMAAVADLVVESLPPSPG